MRSLLLIVAIAIGSSTALVGCTSRTLPLPPPEVSQVSTPDSQGNVKVSGYALEGSSIGIVNDRTMQGTIVTSPKQDCENTCPFEATIPAEGNDTLRVWQFFETEGAIEANVPKQ